MSVLQTSGALQVGATTIAYSVRSSTRATRKRIVVTPAGVDVITPVGTSTAEVVRYVETKRRWLFDAVTDVREQHRAALSQRYASGAKLQYKGRHLMLDVASADVDAVDIACRSKFHVRVPSALVGLARLEAVRAAFDAWLRARATADLRRYGRRHAKRLAVTPAGYRLSDSKHRWGSLTKTGTVIAHWRLIQAPAVVFEYVVAHELAHLNHRNHSPDFWRLLARALPDAPERKAMLERWEQEHRRV